MKRILFSGPFLAILFCASAHTQSAAGVIEGRIVRICTAEGIPNALVTLTPVGPAGLSPEGAAQLNAQIESIRRNANIQGVPREDAQTAVASFLNGNRAGIGTPVYVLTDSTGRFTFRDVPSGRYSIHGDRDGFVAPRVNETYQTGFTRNVTLDPNAPLAPIEMELIPNGVLSGRVFDPQGQPAANVNVTAHRVIISPDRNGGEIWMNGRAVMTNDRGEYRLINVLPGGLWISAAPRPTGPQGSWERTFYGDVTLPEEATRVKVIDGNEVPNLDIHLRPKPSSLYKVSGTAINPYAIANPATGAVDHSISTFQLINQKVSVLNDGRPTFQNAIPVSARPNGEFEIRDVRPGRYDLVAAFVDPSSRQTLFGKAFVEVGNGDVSGITLAIASGVTVNGQLEIRGAQASTIKPESISISLVSLGATTGGMIMRSDAMGRFSGSHIPEERYRVQVNGVPPTAYITDIQYAGKSVFDAGFDLDSKPSLIQVSVNSDGQSLAGTVRGKDGKTVAAATVVLVPPESQRQNQARFRQATTDDSGRYSIRGIAPGQYTIYAWENVYNNAWLNARYLSHFETRGRPLTIGTTPPPELQLDAIATENYLELWAR
jgi:protocatechuate 3,4-dioxygenase beta subunit